MANNVIAYLNLITNRIPLLFADDVPSYMDPVLAKKRIQGFLTQTKGDF